MDVKPISLRTLEDLFVSPCSEDRRTETQIWVDDPACRERMDRSNCGAAAARRPTERDPRPVAHA